MICFTLFNCLFSRIITQSAHTLITTSFFYKLYCQATDNLDTSVRQTSSTVQDAFYWFSVLNLRNEIYTAGLWSKQRQINLALDFAINTYNIFIVCKELSENFEVKKILWWECTGLYRGYIFSNSLFTFYVGLMCRGWPLLQIIHTPTPRNIAHRFVFVSCASSDKVTSDY